MALASNDNYRVHIAPTLGVLVLVCLVGAIAEPSLAGEELFDIVPETTFMAAKTAKPESGESNQPLTESDLLQELQKELEVDPELVETLADTQIPENFSMSPMAALMQGADSKQATDVKFPTTAKRIDLMHIQSAEAHYKQVLEDTNQLLFNLDQVGKKAGKKDEVLVEVGWRRRSRRRRSRRRRSRRRRSRRRRGKRFGFVKRAASKTKGAAKAAARKAKAAALKVKAAALAMLNFVKTLTRMLKKAAQTAACVVKHTGILATNVVLKGPLKAAKTLFKRLQQLIKKLLGHDKGVEKDEDEANKAESDGRINIKALIGDLLGKVKGVVEEAPVVKCFLPMLKTALSTLKNKDGKKKGQLQRATSYMKKKLWDEALKPALPELAPKVLEFALEKLLKKWLQTKESEMIQDDSFLEDESGASASEEPKVHKGIKSPQKKEFVSSQKAEEQPKQFADMSHTEKQAVLVQIRQTIQAQVKSTPEGVHPLLTHYMDEQLQFYQQGHISEDEFAKQKEYYQSALQMNSQEVERKTDLKTIFNKLKDKNANLKKFFELYEPCFDGIKPFSSEFGGCMIQTTIDKLQLVNAVNSLFSAATKTIFAMNKHGELQGTPCSVLNSKKDMGLCNAKIAGNLNYLRGLDKTLFLNSFKVSEFGINKDGVFGKKTFTSAAEIHLTGLKDLELDIDGFVGLYGKEEELAQSKAAAAPNMRKHPIFVEEPSPKTTYTESWEEPTDEDRRLGVKPGERVKVTTALVQTKTGFFKRAWRWAKRKAKEAVNVLCNSLNIEDGAYAKVTSPGAVKMGAQFDFDFSDSDMITNMMAAISGTLVVPPNPMLRALFSMAGSSIGEDNVKMISTIMALLQPKAMFRMTSLHIDLARVDFSLKSTEDLAETVKDWAIRKGQDGVEAMMESKFSEWFVQAIQSAMTAAFKSCGFNVGFNVDAPQPIKFDEVNPSAVSVSTRVAQSALTGFLQKDMSKYNIPKCTMSPLTLGSFWEAIQKNVKNGQCNGDGTACKCFCQNPGEKICSEVTNDYYNLYAMVDGRATLKTEEKVCSGAQGGESGTDMGFLASKGLCANACKQSSQYFVFGLPNKEQPQSPFLKLSAEAFNKMAPKVLFAMEWIETTKAKVKWVMDELRQAGEHGPVAKAVRALEIAGDGPAKVAAFLRLNKLLQGKTSTSTLANTAIDSIKGSLKRAIHGVIETHAPRVADPLLRISYEFLMQAVSFVAEEILSVPVPLSPWGMESGGSVVTQVMNIAMTYAKQWATQQFTNFVKWVASGVIEVIFAVPAFMIKSSAKLFDATILKGMQYMTKGVSGGFEMLTRIVNKIPPRQMKIIKTLASSVYKAVMKSVAPDLKKQIEYYKSLLEYAKKACDYATGNKCNVQTKEMSLLQENDLTVEEIEQRLQNAHLHIVSRPLADSITPLHKFEPNDNVMETEMVQIRDDSATKLDTLVQVMSDIHEDQVSQGKVAIGATKRIVTKLMDPSELLVQMRQLQSQVNSLSDVNEALKGAMLLNVKTATGAVQLATISLRKIGWMKSILGFFKRRVKEMWCLMKEATKQIARTAVGAAKLAKRAASKAKGEVASAQLTFFTQLQGVKGAVPRIIRAVESDLKKVLGLANQIFQKAVSAVKMHSKQDQTLPEQFNKGILNVMDKLSASVPIIGCFKTLVIDVMKVTTPLANKLLSHVDKMAKKAIDGYAQRLLSAGFSKALNPLLTKMYGNGAEEKAKVQVGQLYLAIQAKKQSMSTALMTKVNTLPSGAARDKLQQQLRSTLNGKINLAQLMPAAARMLVTVIEEQIQNTIEKTFTKAWDQVMDVAGQWVIGMATTGINVAASTGSVSTEWLSAGPLTMVQAKWDQVADSKKIEYLSKIRNYVHDIVEVITKNTLGKLPVDSIMSKLQSVDNAANLLVEGAKNKKKELGSIMSRIPESIRAQFVLILKQFFNRVWGDVIRKAKAEDEFTQALAKL